MLCCVATAQAILDEQALQGHCCHREAALSLNIFTLGIKEERMKRQSGILNIVHSQVHVILSRFDIGLLPRNKFPSELMDRRTVAFQLVIPAVFLFFGLLFLKLKPHREQLSVTLTTSEFNPLLQGGGGGGPVSHYVEGGWIQRAEPRSYEFPDSEKALADAVEVAGPRLGPALISMSEYLISSLNESYQSRYKRNFADPTWCMLS
ncbi:hypothetical protein IFM89_007018 [Coptis chinensis]|uniref:Uncharacterized protein n=1 Tax=Coptis chinensis TaxID=261450 RepID=A0A835IMT0_9MAGN|nr:hypothetical protein IFM89_007018 [Coptis chinensis]